MDSLYEGYYDAQYQLLVEIRPEVVGHFDLINMFSPAHPLSPALEAKICRNITAAVEYGALFELNSSAFRKGLPGAHPQADVVQVGKTNLIVSFKLHRLFFFSFAPWRCHHLHYISFD